MVGILGRVVPWHDVTLHPIIGLKNITVLRVEILTFNVTVVMDVEWSKHLGLEVTRTKSCRQ